MNNGCWINLFMLMMRKSANDNSTEAADVVRREPRQAWRSACNFLVFELPDHQSYMAFMVINCMHKNWRGNVKWLDLPLASMHQLFRQQKRYDVLGSWGDDLSRIDEDTGISRNVTDDEVLAYGQSLRDHEDPTGIHLLNKFKTNQLIAKLMRGAIQLGHRRKHFDPAFHMRENMTEDTPQMYSSCTAMLSRLSRLVCQITGYRQYSLLATRDDNTPWCVLCIDPFGLCMMIGAEK